MRNEWTGELGCPSLFDLTFQFAKPRARQLFNIMYLRSQGVCPAVPSGLSFEERVRFINMTEVHNVKRQRRMLRQCHLERNSRNYHAAKIQSWIRKVQARVAFGRSLELLYTSGLERYTYLSNAHPLHTTDERALVFQMLGHIYAIRVILGYVKFDIFHVFWNFVPHGSRGFLSPPLAIYSSHPSSISL